MHQASDKEGGGVEHQEIERVTILGARTWNRAKVVGKAHSRRKQSAEPIATTLGVVLELGTAAAGCIDDDVDQSITPESWKSTQQVTHGDVRAKRGLDASPAATVS